MTAASQSPGPGVACPAQGRWVADFYGTRTGAVHLPNAWCDGGMSCPGWPAVEARP